MIGEPWPVQSRRARGSSVQGAGGGREPDGGGVRPRQGAGGAHRDL